MVIMNGLSHILDKEKQLLIDKVLERCDFFVQTQIWPIRKYLDFRGWLSNFETLDEQYVAAKILLSFLYYPDSMIDGMLEDVIGKATWALSRECGSVAEDFYVKDVYYSSIPGEDMSPTGSGYRFLTKLRDEFQIPVEHIIQPDKLSELLLSEGRKRGLSILFCDDFVGSGNQCVDALSLRAWPGLGQSIYDYAFQNEHRLAFAPVIANMTGLINVRKSLPKLGMFPGHVLGPEYGLFNLECLCWDNDLDLYKFATELIVKRSVELGAQDDASRISARGYGDQGLFLSFVHGIPDAVPALFFLSKDNWTPLKERSV